MVRISWSHSTGELVSVKPGDGPGQYSDTADPTAVANQLKRFDRVSEPVIANAVLNAYTGSLDLEKSVVTTESYPEIDSKHSDLTTTVAFIEPSEIDSRLKNISCNSCNFSPSDHGEWISKSREGQQHKYTDWVCPKCRSTVHTEME